MKRLFLPLIIICITFQIFGQVDSTELPIEESIDVCLNKIRNDSTTFPAAVDDFNPIGYQAKAAFPLNGIPRIWVKGSEKYSFFRVKDSKGYMISAEEVLTEPYYTALIELDDETEFVTVEFIDPVTASEVSIDSVKLVKDNIHQMANVPFSILFYGCFEPFTVDTANVPLVLNATNDTLNYQMRQLVKQIAFNKDFRYTSYDQEQEFVDSSRSKLTASPVAIIGTGDQIYTDAGYTSQELKGHPLSAWAHICNNPYPLLDSSSYVKHLNRAYRNFYSFEPIADVLKSIPSFSVWDDHEIRDGWGSHGDEYYDGKMNDTLAPFYFASREAYIQHQWQTGPVNVQKLPDSNVALNAEFNIKGVPVFAFDLRSERDIKRNRVISESQMLDFMSWCATLKPDQEVIIVLSIPLFAESAGEKIAANMTREMLDDIHDSWEYNKVQRDSIIKEIVKLRERNIKPIIVAGDLHYGAITEIWYELNEERKILAYEVITSGLSHETMGESGGGIASKLKDKREKKGWGDKETQVKMNQFNTADYYISVRFSDVKLNFSAIEFNPKSLTTINIFIVDNDNKSFVQRRLPLNWDKTYEQEKDERTRSLIQFLRRSYTSPGIPKRVLRVD